MGRTRRWHRAGGGDGPNGPRPTTSYCDSTPIKTTCCALPPTSPSRSTTISPMPRPARRHPQRPADHPDGVHPPPERHIRQKDLRLLTRPAPAPPGTIPTGPVSPRKLRRRAKPHRANATPQSGQVTTPAVRSASTFTGSFSTMSTDASGITRKDPFVLGQEWSEGVLARSGHPHVVATQTTPQAPHPHADIPALSVATPSPRPQTACRSTDGQDRPEDLRRLPQHRRCRSVPGPAQLPLDRRQTRHEPTRSAAATLQRGHVDARGVWCRPLNHRRSVTWTDGHSRGRLFEVRPT